MGKCGTVRALPIYVRLTMQHRYLVEAIERNDADFRDTKGNLSVTIISKRLGISKSLAIKLRDIFDDLNEGYHITSHFEG